MHAKGTESKSESPQRPATVRKFHAYERSESQGYEIFWIYSIIWNHVCFSVVQHIVSQGRCSKACRPCLFSPWRPETGKYFGASGWAINFHIVGKFLKFTNKVFGIHYRKRGSAFYIVREVLSVREREREREIDGSDVTIFALKLAMNLQFPCQKFAQLAMSLHFPLPKIRTIGDELTLSLAKISHFSFLPSHFLSHHCGAEIRSSHFPLPKNFSPSLFPLFQQWHETRDEWSKTQEKWSNPAQSYFVLSIEKMNQINTKNYWK